MAMTFLESYIKKHDIRPGERFEIVRKRDGIVMGVFWIEYMEHYGPVLTTSPDSYWTAAETLQKLSKHMCYARKLVAWRII